MAKVSASVVHIETNLGQTTEKTACKLLGDLLGEPLREFGEMLTDQVRYWRWSNLMRLAEKAKAKIDAKSIEPTALPPAFLVPLLEAASMVDEAELVEMWAELLTAGITDTSAHTPAFRATLSSMGGREAAVLRHIASNGCEINIANVVITGLPSAQAVQSVRILQAGGLLAPRIAVLGGYGGPNTIRFRTNLERLQLTPYAAEFLRVVAPTLSSAYPTADEIEGNAYHLDAVAEAIQDE